MDDGEDLIGGHGGDREVVVDLEGIWMVESNEGGRGES